jgi:ParB family chromosome partitioning protein
MVVSGTEIKKDKLTEEQLIPIKELPLEHRDPLALIIARDELSVSDVKRIAKLFKDKAISDGTKNKLLFKSGRELVETWSTFEQNRVERAKSVEPKAIVKVEVSATPIEIRLQKLTAALPASTPLSQEILQTIDAIKTDEKADFLIGIDLLIENLEKHLLEWRNVRVLAKGEELNG